MMANSEILRGDEGYRTRREANFELLRVIAMGMVIALHYLAHGGLLPVMGEALTPDTVTGAILESLCIASVNIWVLISGYFLSQTGVSLRRLLRVILEVLFYTVLITGVMFAAGSSSGTYQGAYGLLQEYCFPISSEHYWFATAYVFMYLFAPILNKGVLGLSRKQLKYTIIGLLLWFSVIKSVVPVAFPIDDYGYGFGWFLCLYLIAAYIRKYEVSFLNRARKGAILYLVSSAVILLVTLAVHAMNLATGHLGSWYGTPFHYNYLPTLGAALGLFTVFRHIRIREGWLARAARFLAPFTFGVYLLHEHHEIRDRWLFWLEDFIGPVPKQQPLMLILHMITSVIIVFLAGCMVDFIRATLFAWLIRVTKDTPPIRRLKQLDASIHKNRLKEGWTEKKEDEENKI